MKPSGKAAAAATNKQGSHRHTNDSATSVNDGREGFGLSRLVHGSAAKRQGTFDDRFRTEGEARTRNR